MTSDLGTEFGLSSIEKVRVQELFPHWDCLAIESDELGAAADHANGQEADAKLDLSYMLPVPGTFHFVGNMSKDVLRDLPNLHLVERQLHSVASYFHYKHSRDVFLSQCLQGPGVAYRSMFTAGPPLLAGGRSLEPVSKVAQWLLRRSWVLRRFWNIVPPAAHGGDAVAIQIQGVDGENHHLADTRIRRER